MFAVERNLKCFPGHVEKVTTLSKNKANMAHAWAMSLTDLGQQEIS